MLLIHIKRQDTVSDVSMITKSAYKIVQGQLDLRFRIKELKIRLLLLKSYVFNVHLHQTFCRTANRFTVLARVVHKVTREQDTIKCIVTLSLRKSLD